MKGIRDWVFFQILSKSLASSRPLLGSDNYCHDSHRDEEFHNETQTSSSGTTVPTDVSNGHLENQPEPSLQQVRVEDSYQFQPSDDEKKMDPLAKIEDLQIKFLRILCQLGQLQDNQLVAKVLYRLHLATLIRTGESDLKSVNLKNNKIKAIAADQEAAGMPELNFAFKILVLGRTGVGKSATINSIFDQTKTKTDAFQPATDCIQEVVGTVTGIKITMIDTPGFFPSTNNWRKNRKIMHSIKRFIRKSPPDIVLYFERLDFINMGYSDFPILKLMTEVFGASIWFNTILVMTHSSLILPEGPNRFPVSYETNVARCTDLVQHYIHQAVSDSKLETPVLLVENHPQCKENIKGEKVLPNGQVWKSKFLLSCICTKVLGDANMLLEFQDSIELGHLSRSRILSLPHLLSSLLRHRSASNPAEVDNEIDEMLLSDVEEEDEYDQLPSIRILTKAQFQRLSKSQKKDYLDELDYREALYLKKQFKEESLQRGEKKLSKEASVTLEDVSGNEEASPEAVMLPDMAVPPSFDSDCPIHRYRCLGTSDQWLMRPVLDPQGWDHDVGFDGISLETRIETKRNIFASVRGQMSKDKQDFNIQSECAAAYADPRGSTYSAGFDVQSTGKDMMYTVRSNTKLRNLKHNIAECGVSLTSFRNNYYVGTKLEDTILVGKRLKFAMNAGRMGGPIQAAYGGSFEATLRGKDYPARNDCVSLTMTILSFNKEMVLGANLQSELRMSRDIKLSVNANLNSQQMGQVCLKMSSSEHLQIVLIAIFSMFKFMLRRKRTENIGSEELKID